MWKSNSVGLCCCILDIETHRILWKDEGTNLNLLQDFKLIYNYGNKRISSMRYKHEWQDI